MRTVTRLACSFLFCVAAVAQSDRGTITGTIVDPAGAVVASAKVEAKNVETGAVYDVASTGTGNYTLSQLPAGTYEVAVAVPGFKRSVRQNIVVQVAGTLRLDVTLEVGSAAESVTVTEAATLLKTESGELSHNMTTDMVDKLPVINLGFGAGIGNVRNPLQAINMIPGSSFANDNTLRVNGLPANTQSIRIEGQDATNGQHREFNQGVQASLDAIQEVTVQVSNYAAEYGQAGGGYFNYTMKSGSNQFHGGVYDYFVNEVLNAGTPFTDAGATNSQRAGQHIRNAQRRQNYGVTFGGPVKLGKFYDGHDKTFFFFNWEQFRESQIVANGLQTVPTPAYRKGDFSTALIAPLTIGGQPAMDSLGQALVQNMIFDPTTTRTVADGSSVRTPFPGNVIPPTRIDPVAARIQGFIPLPLTNGIVNNYPIPAYSNYRHTTIPSFKLDHNLSTTIKLAWYYSENRYYTPNADGFASPLTSNAPNDSTARTTRINYDQSITPTLLLHLGAGLLYLNQSFVSSLYDQSQLGWGANFSASQLFPQVIFGGDTTRGGFNWSTGHFAPYDYFKDVKPTSNASLTWVRGNHTVKFGGEALFEGFPTHTYSRAHGVFTFGSQQTADPWQDGRAINANTGFAYASYFLGLNGSLNDGGQATMRLGNHALAGYVQDSWKVTRKLTLDYGLRYDYVTLLREEHGRMSSASFDPAFPNPAAGGRTGNVIYEATCNCTFNHNYPWALGPRLGAAYQIDSKTVLRMGAGIAYGTAPNQANLGRSSNDFLTLSPPGFGEPASILKDGNPLGPGNHFGNAVEVWPDFTPRYPVDVGGGLRPPISVFIHIDRNSGRPPRMFQWSLGLQREISHNLVIEANYVGNRGAWWTAPVLSLEDYNGLTPQGLKANWGIDVANAADRALLTTRINSPAVLARFPWLANPNAVYPGFPPTSNLNQVFRAEPQFLGLPGFLGPPLGDSWYDSLQAKVTKRLSRGLTVDSAFTWQKELNLGVGADTSYLTPAPNLINDLYNRDTNKQISGFSRPFILVTSFRYTTPGFAAAGRGAKALSYAVKDWNFAGVLRYQSGEVLRVPASNNGLTRQLARTDNPAVWGGGNTYFNRVAGQPLLNFDPNCKCFDPTTQLVLNKDAWVDAPAGTFSTSAPYYNDYRWQRQPIESLSLGRTFGFLADNRLKLDMRVEFFNVFNRLFLASPIGVGANTQPAGPNAAAPTTCLGGPCKAGSALTSGYGFVNTFNGNGSQPRTGQIVARFSF